MSDDNVTTITVFSPSKGPGCERCNYTGVQTMFYPRGPNDLPGNTTIPCQHCIWERRAAKD